MKINIKQAVKLFFQNPSLEMVFIEAIANSLDANASKIDINIAIEAFEQQETLQIKITDNGEGFTDERFQKFCELLKVEEESHKGVGRLVYLSYFDTITINSKFGRQQRTFTYNNDFDGDHSDMKLTPLTKPSFETSISFLDCTLKRLSSYNTIIPNYLRKKILERFYPRFYLMKQEGREMAITININVSKIKKNQHIGPRQVSITLNDIPDLQSVPLNADLISLFEKMELKYSVKKLDQASEPFVITALCIDNRTFNLDDIISNENLPLGYEMIFLLSSTIFNGQVDPSRESITIKDDVLKPIKKLFRDKIAEIIQANIPGIKERNETTKQSISNSYPHLVGYFEEEEIGIISRSKSIENAQQKFMRDQKTILEATSLDDTAYDKALDLSSRSLAEYIVYREKIIDKIATITDKDSEADIHNIILPKRLILKSNDKLESIYNNNLWLLDNKYMTYTTAMSERTMKEVMDEISDEPHDVTDNGRPDIAIIFSDNPAEASNKAVDVVIVELKNRGIKLAKTEEVISQLKQRATKLMKYYPNKIQRIWFYGIVEFNNEFKLSLKNEEYTPLFSKDSVYYKENKIYLDLESEKPYLIGTYILSIDAFIKDARAHNETFLMILKDGFTKAAKK
ncbi:MAG: sensor histidine kinase [Marinilabiliaceae bacterium]|nr:sensor histidine kinase [Marinilabiliaceae bacterium]